MGAVSDRDYGIGVGDASHSMISKEPSVLESRSDFSRDLQLQRLEADVRPWDLAVIGGGATGVGVAVDAAARGYRVALFEQHDFGKGTSSRSTKLIHGGLRYLKQGRLRLVRDALRERGLLCRNAPHLVRPLPTIVPCYARWERAYYGLGLNVYDWLSGSWSLGASQRLSAADALARIPTLAQTGLRGGVLYSDAIFDDTRLLVNLVQTAIECGVVCLNYAPVRELKKKSGRVCGLVAEDAETGRAHHVSARVVVNATGPFSDHVQRFDDPRAEAMIAPSQGIHLVLEQQFLPGDTALIVPQTPDGRVVFAVPWHHRVLVGTTDTPLNDAPLEPRARPEEIAFLLETVAPYLSRKPQPRDIRAVFAGIRPLVRGGSGRKTSQLGRDHLIRVSSTGLVSIMGGKWTTYRQMAQDCVDRAASVAGLPPKECQTRSLPIHGGQGEFVSGALADYGSDGPAVRRLLDSEPAWQQPLDSRLPYVAGQVIWAARHELARTVDDVLARRLRALFLDAEAALAAAPRVAELLAAELGRDANWQAGQIAQFQSVAENYRPPAAACQQ